MSRCAAAVALKEVFSPNVENVSAILQQCIDAGSYWKVLYERTAAAVTAKSRRPWTFALSSIFAHIDAFVQRCVDLLEICHAQLQFAGQRPLPTFGGTNGDSIGQTIGDIQEAFRRRVAAFGAGGYAIFDVRITRWHDDFNAFKAHVKDLEELLIKAMDHALACVPCLQDRILLIESLQVCCCSSVAVTSLCRFLRAQFSHSRFAAAALVASPSML
jgi:dynein heavy chain, axonemal